MTDTTTTATTTTARKIENGYLAHALTAKKNLLLPESIEGTVGGRHVIRDIGFVREADGSEFNRFVTMCLIEHGSQGSVPMFINRSNAAELYISGECTIVFPLFPGVDARLVVETAADRPFGTVFMSGVLPAPNLSATLSVDASAIPLDVLHALIAAGMAEQGRAVKLMRAMEPTTTVLQYDSGHRHWHGGETKPWRSWDSICLRGGLQDTIRADIQAYKVMRNVSTLPNAGRRIILAYGPPGTGKSSIGLAIAAELQLDVYRLNIRAMTEQCLIRAMSCLKNEAHVIVMEDFDEIFPQGDTGVAGVAFRNIDNRGMSTVAPDMATGGEGSGGVTFSALLNLLDGPEAPARSVFYLTTNRLTTFDPAVLRRVSSWYKIEGVDVECVRRFLVYHFGDSGPLTDAAASRIARHMELKSYEMIVLDKCLSRAYEARIKACINAGTADSDAAAVSYDPADASSYTADTGHDLADIGKRLAEKYRPALADVQRELFAYVAIGTDLSKLKEKHQTVPNGAC